MAGSDIPVQTSATAEKIDLYTKNGDFVGSFEIAMAQKLVVENNLTSIRYDVNSALAEFKVAMQAAADAVPKAVDRMMSQGFQTEDDALILDHAMDAVKEAYGMLLFSAGALLPTESVIASLKEHQKVYGKGFRDHPNILLMEEVYGAAIETLPDKRITFYNKRASDDTNKRNGGK